MTFRNKKVLIVEDDNDINFLLTEIVKELQVDITNAFAGTEGLRYVENEAYDLILLDLMLPGMDGEMLLEKVREQSNVPIIVISAKSSMHDKVTLLKNGADDYIAKPFHKEEVLARVEVQLRRSIVENNRTENLLRYHSLEMDTDARKVMLENKPLSLTVSEYDLLQLLLQRPKHAFSKKEIFEAIGKGIYVGDDNTVSVHISNIRKKMGGISKREYIHTVWGIGFMLE